MQSAEALILEKKIVERSQDIKKNAQVLLELIRDYGMVMEDDWSAVNPSDLSTVHTYQESMEVSSYSATF